MPARDKAKIMQQAEKFVLQGKISSAIAEYQKIAGESPADVLVLNTIGDLYIRSGQPRQAISYFVRVAEAYIKSGFHSKAIAMQKKVVNLDPENLEAMSKLAELYAKQGLSAEARTQYLAVAGILEKRGQDREAIEHYRKGVELSPEDSEAERHLARLYDKQNNKEQAKIFYSRAGEHMAARERVEESRQALSRALELDPQYVPALRGCVRLSQVTREYTETLQRLEEAARIKSSDVDIMELLGEVYLATDRLENAESAFKSMIALDENRYEQIFALARHYYNKSQFDKALEQIQTVTAILLSQRESEGIISFLKDILEINPNHIEALTQLAEVYGKINSVKEATATLSKIIDIRIGEENYSEALRIVEQVLETDATNTKFLQMHREIFSEVYPGQAYRSPLPEPLMEEPEPTPGEVISQSVKPVVPVSEPSEVELDLDSDMEIDLSEDLKDIFTAAQPRKKEPEKTQAHAELKLALDALEKAPPEEEPPAAATSDNSMIEAGLQEVDFYVHLGFLVEAQTRLLELAQNAPGHPDIPKRYELIQEEARQTGTALPPVEWPAPPTEPEPALPSQEPLSAIDKSRAIHENNEAVEISLDVEELPEESPVYPKYSIQMLEGIRPDEANHADHEKPKPFTEMVEEIKNFIGVDKDKEADFQTQFDLGVAYKEMGLVDEAIGQFQAAHRLAKEAGDHSKIARCCTLLGGCFLEKDKPAAAIKWCKLGLATPGLSDDEIYALKYELAGAYEKYGDINAALECLNEIYEMNIHYRDVAQRISQLNSSVKTS